MLGNRAHYGEWSLVHQSPQITALELLTVLLAIRHLRHDLERRTILLLVDNLPVVHILNAGRTTGDSTRLILQELVMELVHLRIDVHAQWIPTHLNLRPDMLSRGAVDHPCLQGHDLKRVPLSSKVSSLEPSY